MRARSTRRGKTRARKCSRRDANGRVRSNAPRSVCARACAREPATCPKQQQRPSLFSEKGCGPSRSGGLSESEKARSTERVGSARGCWRSACSFFSVREARNIFKFFWVTPPFPRGARGRNDIAPVGASPRSSPSHERTITTRDERRCGRDAGDGVARAERLRRRGAAWRRR